MIKSIKLGIIAIIFSACSNQTTNKPAVVEEELEKELFKQVPAEFSSSGKLVIPEGFSYQVLFSEGDEVVTSTGKKVPAKGMHDCVVYLPIEGSSEHGYLYVSHEDISYNEDLGHGGGATIFEVKKEKNKWTIVGEKSNIDFTTVGGTLRNCGGKETPYGTVLVAEEGYANRNADIFLLYPDTSDFNGEKRYKNFGFMVEVDPQSKKAIRKLREMGRFSHEDAYCAKDGKTVYLTQDESPACFYKFIADTENDYTKGTLYAYKQSEDGTTGEWLALPPDSVTKGFTRKYAIEAGATLFSRHEWITEVDGKLYISETGFDLMDWTWAITSEAKPANYFKNVDGLSTKFADPYGRVLVFDPSDNSIKPYVEGGTSENDPNTNFASPDGMESANINGKDYIIINEDLIGLDKNRVGGEAAKQGFSINEVYFIDASIDNPTVDSLRRFMIGPKGSETTGSYFTPDGVNYFVSIQHPDTTNPAPFNKSCVIVVTGF